MATEHHEQCCAKTRLELRWPSLFVYSCDSIQWYGSRRGQAQSSWRTGWQQTTCIPKVCGTGVHNSEKHASAVNPIESRFQASTSQPCVTILLCKPMNLWVNRAWNGWSSTFADKDWTFRTSYSLFRALRMSPVHTAQTERSGIPLIFAGSLCFAKRKT